MTPTPSPAAAGALIGCADHERQHSAEQCHGCVVGPTDRSAAAFPPDSHDLIHHDLRWLAQSGSFALGQSQSVQRRIPKRGREEANKHRIRLRQIVGLDYECRPRLSIIAADRDRHKVAPLHASSPMSAAASMKSSASRSSGAPRSSSAWRCASSRNPGALGSGTHTRSSFIPRCRRVARYRWNLLIPLLRAACGMISPSRPSDWLRATSKLVRNYSRHNVPGRILRPTS